MTCGNCYYSWCWSCGRPSDTILHKYGGEFFCNCFNAIFFEISCPIQNKFTKFIVDKLLSVLCFVGVLLLPAIMLVFGIIYGVISVFIGIFFVMFKGFP